VGGVIVAHDEDDIGAFLVGHVDPGLVGRTRRIPEPGSLSPFARVRPDIT
jgi:hypothetical protein